MSVKNLNGRRLIITEDSFSFRGPAPTFPELLDLCLKVILSAARQVRSSAPGDKQDALSASLFEGMNKEFSILLSTFDPSQDAHPEMDLNEMTLNMDARMQLVVLAGDLLKKVRTINRKDNLYTIDCSEEFLTSLREIVTMFGPRATEQSQSQSQQPSDTPVGFEQLKF